MTHRGPFQPLLFCDPVKFRPLAALGVAAAECGALVCGSSLKAEVGICCACCLCCACGKSELRVLQN